MNILETLTEAHKNITAARKTCYERDYTVAFLDHYENIAFSIWFDDCEEAVIFYVIDGVLLAANSNTAGSEYTKKCKQTLSDHLQGEVA